MWPAAQRPPPCSPQNYDRTQREE